METIIIFLAIGLILLAILNIFIFLKFKTGKNEGGEDKNSEFLIQQLNEHFRNIDAKLSNQERSMGEAVRHQFSESQNLIRTVNEQLNKNLIDVTREITETKEASKQVMTIAEQLQNLEKVLKHQKQRGNLGEASLELILSNILPPGTYKMQYEFKDRAKVDAIIVTKDGFIPIDAKFSLDNYNRILAEKDDLRREELEKEFKNDIKKRIDETSKYIRPEEGTLPFAFMFIPAEGIYYDLLINEVGAVKINTRNLIDYAYNDRKVIIVSPTTFAAYLQSVLFGFKAFKFEESAKEIKKNVEKLQIHLNAYASYYQKVGNAIGTVVNHYNASSKEFKKIDKDLYRITGETGNHEPELLDRPNTEEN